MNDSGNYTGNHSMAPYDSDLSNIRWNFLAVLKICTGTTTFVLNTVVLSVFITHKNLHSPFNVYIMNLLICNISYIVLSGFYDVIQWLKPNWWSGQIICEVYLFALNNPATDMTWAQVLITSNRIWAVTFPFSYRRYHTVNLAIGVCIAMWVFLLAWGLPFHIMDSLWYRRPGELYGCHFNLDAQVVYALVYEILIVDLVIIYILGAYPYLLWKSVKFRRTRPATRPTNEDSNDVRTGRLQIKENRTAFTVLTLLTLNAAICWTPSTLVYLAVEFVSHEFPPALYQVGHWLRETSAMVDPFVLFIGIKDLRTAIYVALHLRKTVANAKPSTDYQATGV